MAQSNEKERNWAIVDQVDSQKNIVYVTHSSIMHATFSAKQRNQELTESR